MNVQDVVNAQTLNQILQSGQPVILDFHASWCGPCKKAMPGLATLAQELSDVTFVKIDVDAADPEITEVFQVTSLPLFVLVVEAKQVKRWEGYDSTTLPQIKTALQALLPQVQESTEQLSNGCERSTRQVQTPGVTMRQEIMDCRRQK